MQITRDNRMCQLTTALKHFNHGTPICNNEFHVESLAPEDSCTHVVTYDIHWNTGSHNGDVIMGAITSQITSLKNVYSIVYSGADQGKHQSSASLAFVWGLHRWPVNSPHKWPVTRKMFPFDDVIMSRTHYVIDAERCNGLVPGQELLLPMTTQYIDLNMRQQSLTY